MILGSIKWVLKSKLRKIKILMGINKNMDEKLLSDEDQVYFNLGR